MSRKPEATPVMSAPDSYRAVMRSKLSFSSSSMWLKSPDDARLRELEDDLLGAVDELGRLLALALHAEARDLAAGPHQPAERRHLADDAGVVAGVGRGGHERGQLVDADAPADLLELAFALELVDERDRVDGLAAPV